jgi:hypothetical protein
MGDAEASLRRTAEALGGGLAIDTVDLHVASGASHLSLTFKPERWLLFAAQVEAFTKEHFGKPS